VAGLNQKPRQRPADDAERAGEEHALGLAFPRENSARAFQPLQRLEDLRLARRGLVALPRCSSITSSARGR